MNSYEINSDIDEDLFDDAVISVLPDADKKDENYWNSIQAIPNTLDENIAYSRIDSLSKVAKTFGEDFSIASTELKLNKYFSVTGPLAFYSFNKVQGSTLNFDLYYSDAEEQRLNIDIGAQYGFADDLVKKYLSAKLLFGRL